MPNHGGGDILIGGEPLDDHMRPLINRLPNPEDIPTLQGLLAKYEANISLSKDETAFVFDRAKEIALSFWD